MKYAALALALAGCHVYDADLLGPPSSSRSRLDAAPPKVDAAPAQPDAGPQTVDSGLPPDWYPTDAGPEYRPDANVPMAEHPTVRWDAATAEPGFEYDSGTEDDGGPKPPPPPKCVPYEICVFYTSEDGRFEYHGRYDVDCSCRQTGAI